MSQPYNPLDKIHLGESVASALLREPLQKLGSITRMQGAGVYAIYYRGGFKAYQPLVKHNAGANLEVPIYVGKAIPKGGRRGGEETTVTSEGVVVPVKSSALYERLADHAGSAEVATNLDLADFECRYLIVDDIWIPLAESVMIARTRPLWNRLVDGYGNHDPGSGRYGQQRSQWDTIHPGRPWATKCAVNAQSVDQILGMIAKTLPALLTPPQPVSPSASVTPAAKLAVKRVNRESPA